MSYFYRILDQVLEKERKLGVDHLWTATTTTADGNMQQAPPRGRVVRRRPLPSRRNTTADRNVVGSDEWRGSSTATTMSPSVWEQFKQAWQEAATAREQQSLQSSLPKSHSDKPATTKRRLSKIMIVGLLMTSFLFFMTFSAFGCYGVYVFFFGQPRSPSFSKPNHRQMQQQQQQQPEQSDEVVIRIIRQVVHVDAATGHVLKKKNDDGSNDVSSFSRLKEPHVMNKISECVAHAIDD